MKPGGFDGGLELSDRSELTDTDLVARATYARGRVSRAAFQPESFEKAFQSCYSALAGAPIDGFETIRIVQDLAGDSTTVWLRLNSAHSPADEMQLAFLARATLTILGWLATSTPEMPDLCRAVQVLANGTLPPKSRVPTQRDLVTAVGALEELKAELPGAETLKIILHRGAAEIDVQAPPVDLDSLLRKTLLQGADGEMILIVEEPDYSRTGKWRLRHGKQSFDARFEGGAIVDGFHRRSVDIRPGDALRCRVRIDRSYDSENELLAERLSVVEVLGLLSDEGTEAPPSPPAEPAAKDDAKPKAVEGDVLEQLEGDFGVLTLREIPIN